MSKPPLVALVAATLSVVPFACSSSSVAPGVPDAAPPGTVAPTSSPDATAPPDATAAPPPEAGPPTDASPPPDADRPADAEPPPDTAPPADTAPPDPLTPETVTAAGITRTYGLRLPRGYDPAQRYPLVVVFHGDGEDGFLLYSVFPFQAASGEAAILAYPSAIGGSWDLYTGAARNRDLAFVEAMLTQLQARYSVDATRVFAVGWSNGAYFTNQLACRRSALFRGAASNAGGAPYETETPNDKWPNGFQHCPGQAAVPFFVVQGLADGVVTPASGEFTATYWGYVNGCGGTRAPTTPSPCEAHPGCRPGKPVVYCPIAGMGHEIWSRAAAAEWAFFQGL